MRYKKLTVLVNSSDGFYECWEPFFILFKKHWPEFDGLIILNTEKKVYCDQNSAGVKSSCIQGDSFKKLPWSDCLIGALNQVETDFVLYLQEDYFIDSKVNDELIYTALQHMIENRDVEHIGLTSFGSSGPFSSYVHDLFRVIPQGAKYRISTQAGLWRVSALLSYLDRGESGWMFEIYGSIRAKRKTALFLTINPSSKIGNPISYLHTGIIKGKWLPEIVKVFNDHNISVDFKSRGFYKKESFFIRRWRVFWKLLESPKKIVKYFKDILIWIM